VAARSAAQEAEAEGVTEIVAVVEEAAVGGGVVGGTFPLEAMIGILGLELGLLSAASAGEAVADLKLGVGARVLVAVVAAMRVGVGVRAGLTVVAMVGVGEYLHP